MAALRLRFNIHDGLMTPSGRLCWHLTLLGCTLAEALNETNAYDDPMPHSTTAPPPLCVTPETTTISSPPTSTSPPPPPATTQPGSTATPTSSSETEGDTTNSSTGAMTTTANLGDSSKHLKIVLPVAGVSALFLLVALAILVGVCFYVQRNPRVWRRKNSGRLSADAIASSDTLGMVDNELYRSRSSIFPMAVNHTAVMPTPVDKNSITNSTTVQGNQAQYYENCEPTMHPDPDPDPYNSMFPNYKESVFYETISPRNHPVVAEIEQSQKSVDSMVDNPNYSVPFPLSYRPLDTTLEEVSTPPPLPRPLRSRMGATGMDMVSNECYSVPSSTEGEREDEQLRSLTVTAGPRRPSYYTAIQIN